MKDWAEKRAKELYYELDVDVVSPPGILEPADQIIAKIAAALREAEARGLEKASELFDPSLEENYMRSIFLKEASKARGGSR